MGGGDVDEDAVLQVLVARVREVMAVDAVDVGLAPGAPPAAWRAVRFDEDLHADSLDLVEVVEGVERDLRRRGLAIALPDDEVAGLVTLGGAVERLLARRVEDRP